MSSPSINGADIRSTKSFAAAVTTSATAAAAIQGGGYEVCATEDIDIVISTSNAVTATALPSSQAAESATQVNRVRCFADQPRPLDIPERAGETWYWSAIAPVTGGTLVFNGPFRRGQNG